MTSTHVFSKSIEDERIRELSAVSGLSPHYLDDIARHVAPLAAALCREARRSEASLLVGINGCQGSGKSTMAQFLSLMLEIGAAMRCPVLSIDDFYLKKSARQELARDVHPLFATRGVPGTHDLALAEETVGALLDKSRPEPVSVPGFDKTTDDRVDPARWRRTVPGADLVVLEGWCVGCPPETKAALSEPVNELESSEDSNGRWRSYVNERLDRDYRHFFARLDVLIMLEAPGFECVYKWRHNQERQLEKSLGQQGPVAAHAPLLGDTALRRFISHFERLTRHQLEALPAISDAVIELSADHRMAGHRGRLYG